MCFVSRPMKSVTFPRKNGDPAKRVVDFHRERETFRTKIMEIVEDSDEKSYNNGKPWKSSRILRVNPNFFIFLSFFHQFAFFSFFFFFFSSFSSFSFYLIFCHVMSCSFIFCHDLSFSFFSFILFFFFFLSFSFCRGAQQILIFFRASISLRFLFTFLVKKKKINFSARLGRGRERRNPFEANFPVFPPFFPSFFLSFLFCSSLFFLLFFFFFFFFLNLVLLFIPFF